MVPLIPLTSLENLDEERIRVNEDLVTRLEFYKVLLITPFIPLYEKTKDLLGQYVR